MRIKTIIAALIIFTQTLFSQTNFLHGKISDAEKGAGLPFANVRVENTSTGTSANINGVFELKIKAGSYLLVVSYIGYRSDTLRITVPTQEYININLEPITLELPEVVVLPGHNPALDIIRKAIKAKHKRNENLESYSFRAYTKGLVKTTEDISSNDNSVGIDLGEPDSAKLKITGIIENESIGYFKKPDLYKEEILAQKQTSNVSSQINVVTGGRIIQNFYGEDIQFFGRPLPGPIADNALDYYYFYITDRLALNNKLIYEIYFAPDNEYDPGFSGNVYIEDGSFALVKIDAAINRAANPGRIFDEINIFQQFFKYDDIYMPVDYRVFVEGNFLGLAKFGFELNSILYDYSINPEMSEDEFGMTILKVEPGADQKDSIYWKSVQTIPNTDEELSAYHRIDSLEALPVSFWDRFSPLSMRIAVDDNWSVSGPLSIYHFNRVEGHSLGLGIYHRNGLNKRLRFNTEVDYGFSDKKLKGNFSASLLLGPYRTSRLSARIFDRTSTLFNESDRYNPFTSTILSLFSKYDFRDYYYSKGFNIELKGDVFPVLSLGLGFENRTDKSAVNNTDYSFFYHGRTYKTNQSIYDARINSLKASFVIDFRKFIEDGYFRRRVSTGPNYFIIDGEAIFSGKRFLSSQMDFNIYKLNIRGRINTFKSSSLHYLIKGIFSDGPVPVQMLYALPGNINGLTKGRTFKTLRIGEIFGDKVFTVNLEHSWQDELFILLGIPGLRDMQLNFNTYLNVAWSDISAKSLSILPVPHAGFKTPFIEAGFGIGQMLLPMTFEFTWKLTHLGYNNFVFGINTFVF